MKKALITGITGQDGAYLSELLLSKGYEVHGVRRYSSVENGERICRFLPMGADENGGFLLHYGDVTDSSSMATIVDHVRPDEIYNLAAQSHVQVSFGMPAYTAHANALGVLHILEAIRICGSAATTKFYQASTSELFGNAPDVPQRETTPFCPRSPYAVAKLYAYWMTLNYREAYGLFACNGILFNHESPLRGENFVSRKISQGVAGIKLGLQEELRLGNLDARRDWGFAGDYVQAMWLILQQETPGDYVIGTGECHTVREFVEEAFKSVGSGIAWRGKGVEEIGIDANTGKAVVKVDARFFRPTEVNILQADSTKAMRTLGWQPRVSFSGLVKMMVEEDLKRAEQKAARLR